MAFLDDYFTAINTRNYRAYVQLLGPQGQASFTRHQFIQGFRSTVDYDETLQKIATAANGNTVAKVTFTSNQRPADSVNHRESCTRWRISLYLQPAGGGYILGQPPSGYHASYSACP